MYIITLEKQLSVQFQGSTLSPPLNCLSLPLAQPAMVFASFDQFAPVFRHGLSIPYRVQVLASLHSVAVLPRLERNDVLVPPSSCLGIHN